MALSFYADANCERWPAVRHWIEDACNHGDGWWTVEKLIPLLCEGRAVLWVLEDNHEPQAAIITAIADWDGQRVAECIAQGGSGVNAALGDHLHTIEDWARKQGATELYMRGRRGLSRVYRPFGYEEIAVTMRKAL